MGFFERVVKQSDSNTIIRETDHEALYKIVLSVKKNIEFVLNSRQGCTQCAPDLGLEDFNDATADSRCLFISVMDDIKNSIETYEPRVKISKIDLVTDEKHALKLNFRLVCSIFLKRKREVTELNLILDSSNKQFSVE